jgi:hypothetical protein
MNRSAGVLLTMLSLSPWPCLTSQSIPNATSVATLPADPKDVASVDAIVAALYDANTILVDQKRDADRFRSLFVPGARLMPTFRPLNGKAVIGIQTVDDYVQRASSGQPRHGFSEREIARTSQAFGNIVQVFSTYETHRDSTDTHPGRGINSIQLFNDGSRWWVVGVLWDNERPEKPIPPEFLKRRAPSPPAKA